MLNWSRRFNIFCFLDNNNYPKENNGFDCILAAGSRYSVFLDKGEPLQKLKDFSLNYKGWLFGHLGYDLFTKERTKNKPLYNEVEFGNGFFFSPQVLIRLQDQEIIIESETEQPSVIFAQIDKEKTDFGNAGPADIQFSCGVTEEEYYHSLASIRDHIIRGDCYEINFCQSFYSNNTSIDPWSFYQRLSAISPNPFAAFYRLNDKYCLCASPERFLKKTGPRLISQPIKGTIKRILSDESLDLQNMNYLKNSEKERTENVMVVDLVRNDMSKVCGKGSVQVNELFGIYSFPQVHQMISTIEGNIPDGTHWTEIISACFPMGSMTGAPKKRVLELIEKYEPFPRGLFSGSIGYIDPAGDFDFNVVIRSLMYDETKKIISFKAGGGITFNSEANQEYQECLLKAAAIIAVLKSGGEMIQ